MAFQLNDADRGSLKRFLDRRSLKARTLALLKEAIDDNELKRGQLTQNQNATYAQLAEALEKALHEEWLDTEDFINLLDESEQAGRQHVCVFELPPQGVNAILNAIKTPNYCSDDLPTFTDFWEVPEESYARVLESTSRKAVVKIVAKRRYWRSEKDEESSTEDEEWIRRWVVEERSALIVKCVKSSGLVQIRVPPREQQTQAETGKSVYEFAMDTLPRHFDMGENSWFSKLHLFSITDSYNSILDNRDDFFLRHDAPESTTAKSRLSKKGALKKLDDLRDDPMWQFGNGYARKTMRGTWVIEEEPVYTHLNLDKVRLDADTTFEYARVFFPHLATDAQVDHAIQRIKDHIQ